MSRRCIESGSLADGPDPAVLGPADARRLMCVAVYTPVGNWASVPEVSDRPTVLDANAAMQQGKSGQRLV